MFVILSTVPMLCDTFEGSGQPLVMGDFWTVPFHSSAQAQTYKGNTEHVRARTKVQKRTIMSAATSVSKLSHCQRPVFSLVCKKY